MPVLSSMGAANKLDPTAFRVADIEKTSVDPLARIVRLQCRKRGIRKLKVVFSTEPPLQPLPDPGGRGPRRPGQAPAEHSRLQRLCAGCLRPGHGRGSSQGSASCCRNPAKIKVSRCNRIRLPTPPRNSIQSSAAGFLFRFHMPGTGSVRQSFAFLLEQDPYNSTLFAGNCVYDEQERNLYAVVAGFCRGRKPAPGRITYLAGQSSSCGEDGICRRYRK